MKILGSKKTSVGLVLILGCLLSLYCYWMVQKERNAKIQSTFDEIVADEASRLQRGIDDYFDEMLSLQSFYLSSTFVSRDEFRLFTSRILRRLNGVQVLKWLPLIKEAERAEFENTVAKEGFPDFQIKEFNVNGELKTAGVRERYFPSTYFEPAEGNDKTAGFDFLSEKNRAEALSKAIEKQDFSIISSERLIEDNGRKYLLIFIPVYKNLEDGHEVLTGVLEGAFYVDAIIEKELGTGKSGGKIFCFEIFDVTEKNKPVNMYSSIDPILSGRKKPEFISEKAFEVNGHAWKLSARPCLNWLQSQQRGAGPISVFFSGLAATFLFALYLSLFIDRTKGIESAVDVRTAELAKANDKISLSEQNFRGLVSNIPGAVYRCAADKDWTMEFISEEVEKISGYPETDFIGNKVRTYASIIHPEDTRKVERDVQKGIDSRTPYILEYRILDSEGKEKWIYEKGQAIFSSEGKVLYLDGAIFDITERKKLSEQLLQSRKMEAIGKLSGGIAHDFNNQLMVILGYCQIMLERMDSSQAEYSPISDIKLAAEKSSALVRQLLAFGRKDIVAASVFDLNALIHALKKMIGTVLGEQIECRLKLAEYLGMIRMDQGQMEQVLLNLVVNAKDAMIKGGISELETRNIEISNLSHQDLELLPGEYVLLTLKDNGTGMSEDVKNHLFEPFFSTKEKHKGTGLGLATCYSVIRAAGGIIQVRSQIGEGTVFNIYIPISTEAFVSLEGKNISEKIPMGDETILLVEDEDKVRLITALILRNRGYSVLEFGSGKQAVEFLERSENVKMDLLLSDVMMPELSGPQLAEKVKRIRPGIRTLFMSGYTEDSLLRQGIERHQVNFLHKPCEAGAMCRKVREILDSKIDPPSIQAVA